MPFCPNCGKEAGTDSVFCASCGSKLKGEQKSPSQASFQKKKRASKRRWIGCKDIHPHFSSWFWSVSLIVSRMG